MTSLISRTKENKIPVIYVVVGFRPGMPEISQSNISFSSLKKEARDTIINPRPALELEDSDIVVTKKRVSAFAGSDLEVVLRALGIQEIVLTGIATSGVVLSTLRQAADMDYKIRVLSDLCADFDDEVHNVLINKVFPRQAIVESSDQWIKGLGA
jgi:nicotinamidase-related amidase